MIRHDRDESRRVETMRPVNHGWKSDVTEAKIAGDVNDPDRSITEWLEESDEGCWTLQGIGWVDSEGETTFKIEQSTVQYREIRGAESINPPKKLSSDRPEPRLITSPLGDYG